MPGTAWGVWPRGSINHRLGVSAITTAASGLAYASGGSSSTTGSPRISDHDEYSITGNSWTSRADQVAPARTNPVSAKIGNVLYTSGGFTGSDTTQVDSYTLDAWTTTTPMLAPARRNGAAAQFNSGFLYYGGLVGSVAVQDADLFQGGVWAERASLPAPARRQQMPLKSPSTGEGYSAGGIPTGGNYLDDVDRYTQATDAWDARTILPAPARGKGSAGMIGAMGYVYGGEGFGLPTVTNNERYDTALNSWLSKASLSFARDEAGSGFSGSSKVFVCGGVNATPATITTVESYVEDAWSAMTSIPSPARAFQGDTDT